MLGRSRKKEKGRKRKRAMEAMDIDALFGGGLGMRQGDGVGRWMQQWVLGEWAQLATTGGPEGRRRQGHCSDCTGRTLDERIAGRRD